MRYALLILTLVFLSKMLFSQEQAGIAGSTRAPLNTLFSNPSTIVDSRAFIDINLVGADLFVRNNLVFIPSQYTRLSAISNMESPGFNLDRNSYRAYADVMLHGPSVYFAVKSSSFAIFTNVRIVTDARGIDGDLATYLKEGFQFGPLMGQRKTSKNLRAHALGWAEAGLTYGTILSRQGDLIVQGALSVKRLWGVAGVGLRIDEWSYTVRDSSTIETDVFRGEYGFNDPSSGTWNNGKGWSSDIGVTWKMRKSSSDGYTPHDPCTDGDYLYRFGISLLDVGRIAFNEPTFRNVFDQSEQSQWNDFSNTQVEDGENVDSLLTEGFGAAQDNSDARPLKLFLPMGISFQADYNLWRNFYVFGSFTAGIPWLNNLGVQRATTLSVVPRFEIKRFEFSLPVNLHELRYPTMGACLRLNSIVIGSDDLLGILLKRNLYGADFYFSLKYTLFKHWACDKKERKSKPKIKRSRGFEPVPCPSW